MIHDVENKEMEKENPQAQDDAFEETSSGASQS